ILDRHTLHDQPPQPITKSNTVLRKRHSRRNLSFRECCDDHVNPPRVGGGPIVRAMTAGSLPSARIGGRHSWLACLASSPEAPVCPAGVFGGGGPGLRVGSFVS